MPCGALSGHIKKGAIAEGDALGNFGFPDVP